MKIIIERGKTVPFKDLPAGSVALDGYVQGPEIDLENLCFSFDHHDNCIRLITRATCQQVMDAMLLGFDPTGLNVYINDVDADTVLAVWLLQNPDWLLSGRLRSLIEAAGALDAHGPAYPVHPDHQSLVDTFFWTAMEPEREARRTLTYQTCDLSQLLHECMENVTKLMRGELPIKPLIREPQAMVITHQGTGWVMVHSDTYILDHLYALGYSRMIVYRVLPDETFQYTVAKKSDLVADFPVGPHSKDGSILHILNAHEKGWGGGSTIGGSPRNEDGSSSRLTPKQVFEIVERIVTE